MLNNYCVYIHTSPSGKRYVGITCQNPIRRWRKGKGYKPKNGQITPFWNAIQRYGWDNFKHEIVLSGLSKADACQAEIDLIEKYRTRDNEFGYNVSVGGDVPMADCSDQTRQKMRNSAYEKWSREEYVKTHTGEEHWTHKQGYSQKSVDAMRKANTGIKRTQEQIERLREKGKGQKRLRGKDNGKSTMIECVDKCGNVVGIYYGSCEAERETGVPFQNIMKVCHGERKSAGGYLWRFNNAVQE